MQTEWQQRSSDFNQSLVAQGYTLETRDGVTVPTHYRGMTIAEFRLLEKANASGLGNDAHPDFIGHVLTRHDSFQVSANIKARRLAEWEAGRAEREARRDESDLNNAEAIANLEAMRNGTPYERACYDEFILNMKDCWSADDYAESDRLISIKRNAAANLNIAA